MAEAINQTLKTFGYPQSLIREYDHWCVLLRPVQVTLGSQVLVCKDEARQFSAISPDAFSELSQVTSDIETALKRFRSWDKINYLMLMMVDPDVHFHVLPRYGEPQDFAGQQFIDGGWPKLPDMAGGRKLEPELQGQLRDEITSHWRKQ